MGGRAPGTCCTWALKKLGRFTELGHALTGDRTRRSRGVGWEYVHSIVDDCSRLAYSEIHDDEKGPGRDRVHPLRTGLVSLIAGSSPGGS
jgi:hypothetical protein